MRSLGLELREQAVRAVVGEHRRGHWQLVEAQLLPLRDRSPETLATVLSPLLAQHSRGVSHITLALPLNACTVKLLHFPPTSEENLARLARLEAETQVPLPAEQLEFSHTIVEVGHDDRPATVAIAACRRDTVADALRPLATAGAVPDDIDVSAMALANAFCATVRRDQRDTAVVNVDDGAAELVVLDAEARLRGVHVLPAEVSVLAVQVRRALQVHEGATGHAVEQVLVTGSRAGEALQGLQDLDREVRLGNPWAEAHIDDAPDRAATFAVATGAMLRGGGHVPLTLDLTPQARLEAASQRRQSSRVGLLLLAIMVLVIAVGVFVGSRYQSRKAELASLERQLDQLQQRADSGEDDPALLQALSQTRIEVLSRGDWLGLLNNLAQRLPAGVTLREITLDAQRPVVIRGQAFSNALIAETLEVLADMGLFARVRHDYANADRVGDELVYSFSITCLWPGEDEATP